MTVVREHAQLCAICVLLSPRLTQPQDLAVIGHGDDLLCWIHALACTHILPQNPLLFNSCGDAVQFARNIQIEREVGKKGLLHSDRDVTDKIQKVQYDFKDYELAMYIFSFLYMLK